MDWPHGTKRGNYPFWEENRERFIDPTMMVEGRTWVSAIGGSEGMPYGEAVGSFERVMVLAGDRISYGSKILSLLTMSD